MADPALCRFSVEAVRTVRHWSEKEAAVFSHHFNLHTYIYIYIYIYVYTLIYDIL